MKKNYKLIQEQLRKEMEDCIVLKLALYEEKECLDAEKKKCSKELETFYKDVEQYQVDYDQLRHDQRVVVIQQCEIQSKKNSLLDWEEELCIEEKKRQHDVEEKEQQLQVESEKIQCLIYSIEQDQIKLEEANKVLQRDCLAQCIRSRHHIYQQEKRARSLVVQQLVSYFQHRCQQKHLERTRLELCIQQKTVQWKRYEVDYKQEQNERENERLEHKNALLCKKQDALSVQQEEMIHYMDQLLQREDDKGYITKEEIEGIKQNKCLLM